MSYNAISFDAIAMSLLSKRKKKEKKKKNIAKYKDENKDD